MPEGEEAAEAEGEAGGRRRGLRRLRRGVALSWFRRRGGDGEVASDPVLIVGLGNPGDRYARTRHNAGFEVARGTRAALGPAEGQGKYGGLITEGRIRAGGPRVALLLPQTYMNESGTRSGPPAGQLRVPLEELIAIHDEIDLPFGEIRAKLGGGVAGHNGLKSLRDGLGGSDFWRLRIGVGRPDSTDPEIVSAYVLGRFAESDDEVAELISRAADEAERLVERIAEEEADPIGEVSD